MSTFEDKFGKIDIPEGALWGVNTQRSLQNFPIGHETMPESLIEALIVLKKVSAKVHRFHHKMDEDIAKVIVEACDYLLDGDLKEAFPLSIWQTGSGTQTNMNVNEVIAHLANTRFHGHHVHPNDHVNQGQSSNDIFPSAMHISTVLLVKNSLMPSLEGMIETFDALIDQYGLVMKTGRTHLQDATPITFGQELGAWRHMYQEGLDQLNQCLESLQPLAMGATAVGTGLNSYEGFDQAICDELNQMYHESFRPSVNKFHAISSKDSFVFLQGALAAIASNSLKMANDIRFLASGPRCGLGEISLPENEAGSSIMPGKVNPTQCEALMMVCAQVMGNQTAVTVGAALGNFQLNTFMPLIIHNTTQSICLLSDALNSFNLRCLQGIEVDKEKMSDNLHKSLMTATFLNRQFGYDHTAKIVNQAHQEGKSIKTVVVESGAMGDDEFDAFFDYQKMIQPD
ncbi:class II fumarate hydratase [Erysipelothrix rhusiopathiae]|nr:class II fumarate hydratase [Erysipelothrix rhusiopathiae]MDE8164177.1 class II fumarate hydratase [Erysipelothrix rhusiopathiae]MDE8192522.1 class II fumarate hydratase [Erysipelothrix rhusiopathiae]MDE8203101.1 class II fumarate hydratase [Erysipelothrix rhusiopathiae]MDE8268791.1 class II fumarate hydratase [Erysipelothrix rhusiopathiae]